MARKAYEPVCMAVCQLLAIVLCIIFAAARNFSLFSLYPRILSGGSMYVVLGCSQSTEGQGVYQSSHNRHFELPTDI